MGSLQRLGKPKSPPMISSPHLASHSNWQHSSQNLLLHHRKFQNRPGNPWPLLPGPITATQGHTAGLTRQSRGVPSWDSELRRSKTRTRKLQQRLQPRNSGALVLRFQHDPVATQRKSSHQTVSAMTRRKDIIKGIRGEGKMLEYSWHFLSDFCSSGIAIETFGRVASLAGRGKAVSVGIACFFSLSSSCTNRGRSRVCFRGRRSRKTERDEQKWQMESAQNDTWRCAKR